MASRRGSLSRISGVSAVPLLAISSQAAVMRTVNLNKTCKDKIKKVVELEQKAMPARDDIEPLLGISLDLAAGLARLAKTKS